MKIKIEVSGRHIHLSSNDLNKLFGSDYELQKLRDLSQPGEFACEEKVLLRNGNNEIAVRIIGPARGITQIEISQKDAAELNINPPRRMSGDLRGSAGIKIIGPKDGVDLIKGVILSQRHIHLDKGSAKKLNLSDNQKVDVRVDNQKSYVFKDVLVRVGEKYKPALHIDTDDAVEADIKRGEVTGGTILQ
ncbi:MAG: phosphate propanoyltransferase [Patescibacteria group bacterium]|jgi:putative phosphotransacetylase